MTAFLCSWVSRLMLKTTLGLDDSKHSKKKKSNREFCTSRKGNYPHSGGRTNRLPVFNEINTFLNFVMTKIIIE